MNMPLVLLNRRRRGFTAFSPSTLFSTTAIGIWLDPSDVANLAWRRNLLTYSEQFDNAVWAKIRSTITPNAATAPDGTLTADKLVEDTTSGSNHFVEDAATTVAGQHTFSIRAKAGERNWICLYAAEATVGRFFNLSTGAKGSTFIGAPTSDSITLDAEGFYICSITFTATTSTTARVYVAQSDASVISTGDGTSGIFIWGAQLELGTSATDYQRISDVNTEVIERFPSATMFSDRAGTTAVTTPGTVVGLRLDKSKGLVLGAELVVNGDFASGTGWIAAAGVTISGGLASFSAVTSSSALYRAASVEVGKWYEFTIVVSSRTSGGIQARLFGGATQAEITAAGTYKYRDIVTSVNFNIGCVANAFTGTIDNISVRELAGNHAVAPTDAARPIYGVEPKGGRRNLLTFSEDLSNAIWFKSESNVLANSTNSPTGTATGDTARLAVGTALTIGSLGLFTSSTVYVSQPTATALTAGTHTYSLYVKGGVGLSHVQLRVGTSYSLNPATGLVIVRLSDGEVVAGSSSGGEVVSNAGGGWWRVSIPFTATAAVHHVGIWFWNTSSIASAVGTEGIYIWGAQLELGSTATNYQRVTTAYDVTESGVATCHYVQYDGSDDSMSTAAIDFTATDKMSVFAGVRKLSDAALGIIIELSPSAGAGAFYLAGPRNGGTADYGLNIGGTLRPNLTSAASFASPVTSVLTGTGVIGDTDNSSASLRINGVVAVAPPTNLGTGTFGNYPLYLGRRNNATLPFNGRDYGLIVVGKAASAGEITDTETWLAAKTSGVTL